LGREVGSRDGRRGKGVESRRARRCGAQCPQVAAVLRDPELRGLLTDPGMQRVLEECGTPAGLARHLRDTPTKARLLRLARAGLVRLEL